MNKILKKQKRQRDYRNIVKYTLGIFLFVYFCGYFNTDINAANQYAYFTKTSDIKFYGNYNKSGNTKTLVDYDYSNMSADSINYIVYGNAVETNGEYYDLVIYPFKGTQKARVAQYFNNELLKNSPVIGVPGAGYAGFKFVITKHEQLNNPVSINAIVGFSDLDLNEYVVVPQNFNVIHQGKNITTSSVTTPMVGTKYISNSNSEDTNENMFNHRCVVGTINIPSTGLTVYWGGGQFRLGSLAFDEILDYLPDIIPSPEYEYNIRFNANGGSGSVPSAITKESADSSVVMGDIGNEVPVRPGYIFMGWSASSSWNSKRIAYNTGEYGGDEAKDGTKAAITSSSWSYYDYCFYTGGSSSSRTLNLYAQWQANKVSVTYKDRIYGTDTDLGSHTESVDIGSTISGADKGSSKTESIYYTGYVLDDWTTAIAEEGAVVYRYFKPVMIDITGMISWNDRNNQYGTRPESSTVRLYKNGEFIDSIAVSTSDKVNIYSFSGLQKYDAETGKVYVYTVSQDTAYSQAALATKEDKYITTQDGYNFLNTISNTDADKPDDPDDKGFYIEGNIYWEDNDDSLGFRPSEVTVTLYQKGEDGEWHPFREPIVVDSKTDNHYLFDWLPKYWYDENNVPNTYEYKVEESFTSWYVEGGVMKDAYKIYPDTPKDCDFTNEFVFPGGPIIPVNEYKNTLVIKTNVEEEVRIVLKPLELFINPDYSVSYGEETGNDITVMTDNTGNTIDDMPVTKYEIVIDSTEYTLDDIKLSLPQNVELENIGGKWYVTIGNQPEDAFGILNLELTKKDKFYQDSTRINNYFAIK